MHKILHKTNYIIDWLFLQTPGDANEWTEIKDLSKYYEQYLIKYIELKNGITLYDTIKRVFSIVSIELIYIS